MATQISAYFDHITSTSEQALIDSVVVEAIQHRGITVHYLLREGESDFLFGEDSVTKFDKQDTIEMYLQDMVEFSGENDLFMGYGFSLQDSATLSVSITRFTEEFNKEPFNLTKPRIGDLIYIPFADLYMEVLNVLTDEDFYQKGITYTHRLKCERYVFSHDDITEPVEDTSPFDSLFETGTGTEVDPIDSTDIGFDQSDEIQTEADDTIIFDPSNFHM